MAGDQIQRVSDNNRKSLRVIKVPTTDSKLFEYTLADDGDKASHKITGIKSPR